MKIAFGHQPGEGGEKMLWNRKGFTLVELLVVITIIGILGAILFPFLRTAMKRAKSTRCTAAISTLEIAVKAYMTDFGTFPDYPEGNAPTTGPGNRSYFHVWGNGNDSITGERIITVGGVPENQPDVIVTMLTGRFWDPDEGTGGAWKMDEKVRGSNRWNGPYLELSEQKDYTNNTNRADEDRMFFADGWDRRDPSLGKVKTYYKFQFAQTRSADEYTPAIPSGNPVWISMIVPTFNVDSFDIWSCGPNGEEKYYESLYRAGSVIPGAFSIEDRREVYDEDRAYGGSSKTNEVINEDNIGNW